MKLLSSALLERGARRGRPLRTGVSPTYFWRNEHEHITLSKPSVSIWSCWVRLEFASGIRALAAEDHERAGHHRPDDLFQAARNCRLLPYSSPTTTRSTPSPATWCWARVPFRLLRLTSLRTITGTIALDARPTTRRFRQRGSAQRPAQQPRTIGRARDNLHDALPFSSVRTSGNPSSTCPAAGCLVAFRGRALPDPYQAPSRPSDERPPSRWPF